MIDFNKQYYYLKNKVNNDTEATNLQCNTYYLFVVHYNYNNKSHDLDSMITNRSDGYNICAPSRPTTYICAAIVGARGTNWNS